MPVATWNGAILAQSDDTIVVEGNHYFPANAINPAFFEESATQSHCPWKGFASYKTLIVSGERNLDAAWYYPEPLAAAAEIKGRFAFWKGVTIS
ncbi:MAG: DUF427 domain-containing protein [Sphingomonas sp.]|jgi:uncharacterized protein (DUF427 family)